MNNTKTRVNFNIDRELKENTMSTLDDLGIDMTTAINIFFKYIVKNREIPFLISDKPQNLSADAVLGRGWREKVADIEDEWV